MEKKIKQIDSFSTIFVKKYTFQHKTRQLFVKIEQMVFLWKNTLWTARENNKIFKPISNSEFNFVIINHCDSIL